MASKHKNLRAALRKVMLGGYLKFTLLSFALYVLLFFVGIVCVALFQTGRDLAGFALIAAFLIFSLATWVILSKRERRKYDEFLLSKIRGTRRIYDRYRGAQSGRP